MAEILVWVGDITQLEVSAIVNAANSQLAGGGGVDGAIHRAAGYKELHEACAKLGGCPTGEVRVTPAFRLPASAIIHAVGPIWRGGDHGEPEALRSCYRAAMKVALLKGFESIAFPSISCGVYGYPHQAAVDIAVGEIMGLLSGQTLLNETDSSLNACSLKNNALKNNALKNNTLKNNALKKVIFCCFSESMAELYRQRLTAS